MSVFIDEHRDVFGVEPICRALRIAPSTSYAVKQRQAAPSARALRDAELLVEIRRIYEQSKGLYGAGSCRGSCAWTASRPPAARSSG